LSRPSIHAPIRVDRLLHPSQVGKAGHKSPEARKRSGSCDAGVAARRTEPGLAPTSTGKKANRLSMQVPP
jgi:hypothetical protein